MLMSILILFTNMKVKAYNFIDIYEANVIQTSNERLKVWYSDSQIRKYRRIVKYKRPEKELMELCLCNNKLYCPACKLVNLRKIYG